MNWDDLRVFLAIAREGSLSGAARALGVNHSTVFRRLNDFEQRVGTRLFERLATGYALTPAGDDMRRVAARVEEEIEGLDRRLGGQDVRLTGTLRATAPDTISSHLLAPHLAGFAKAYPGIQVELDMANAMFNLSKREADVALRPTRRPPPNLVGRRLCTIAFAAYAAPAYMKKSKGRNSNDPAAADPIANDPGAPDRWHWLSPDDSMAHIPSAQWLAKNRPNATVPFRSNSYLALAVAAAAGIGVVHLPCFVADRTPGLRRVLDPDPELSSELWLLTHEDLRRTARVRAFMDFMAEAILTERALLEGRGEKLNL